MSNARLTNPNEIDALPDRAVVIDRDGDVWQYRRGLWCTYETAPVGSERLARKYGPVRILREAHIPTDDGREASQELCDRCGWATSGHLRSQYGLDCPPGGSRPGFRRYEAPEPTVAEKALAKIREASLADLGWVDFGKRVDEILEEQAVSEPQGEPSDAQVEAAARAIYEVRDDAFDMDVWEQLDSAQQERYVCDARAALRAAGGVR